MLRRRDFGEADRLVTLMTDRYGKVRALAKGTRRTKSRLGGHLEPYARTNVLIARGRNLDIITQAQVVDSMNGLRSAEAAIVYSAHWAELVDLLMVEQQENRPCYLALIRALTSLDHGRSPSITSRIFESEVLTAAGFRPELFSCIGCGKEIEPGNNGINIDGGGVMCPECHVRDPQSRDVSTDALKFLRAIARGDGERVHRQTISEDIQAEIEQVLIGFLRHVTEQDLNAFRVLKSLQFGR